MTILNFNATPDFAVTAVNNRQYTIPYACAVGTFLAVGVTVNAAVTTAALTDSQGNSYTRKVMQADTSVNHTVLLFVSKITTARPANATVTLNLNTTKTRWAWTSLLADDVISAVDQATVSSVNGNSTSPRAWTVGPTGTTPDNTRLLRICVFGTTDVSGNISMSTIDLIAQCKTNAGSSDRQCAIGAGYVTDSDGATLSVNGDRDAQAVWCGGLIALAATPPAPTGPTVSVWDGSAEHAAAVTVWDGSAEHAGSISFA